MKSKNLLTPESRLSFQFKRKGNRGISQALPPTTLVLSARALSRRALREIALGIQTCRSQTRIRQR
jgi:hypothetical protein